MTRPRTIGRSGPPRVAIADDAGLLFSDDWRNGWLKGFQNMGCAVQVTDISPLRQLGAGGPYSVRGSSLGKMTAQNIIQWDPDLVWCHHGRAAQASTFLDEFRKAGVPTAVYCCDDPYELGETARYSPKFDYVFTMDPCAVGVHHFSRQPAHRSGVFYLPACADEDLFPCRNYKDRKVNAFFLGNPTLAPRTEWLKAVEKVVPFTDIRHWPQLVRGRMRTLCKGQPGWIDAKDHPQHYSNCIVGLNIHRDPRIDKRCWLTRVKRRAPGMAIPMGITLCKEEPKTEGTGFWNDGNTPAAHINPRFFEFAASGTCVVSDNTRSELDRLFPCAPRADTVDRFVELVLHFVEHQDEAEEIGRLCSSLVSKAHTYRHRVAEVLIRVGLMARVPGDLLSYLGAQEDWLSLQDWKPLGGRSPSEPTGRFELWSPASGSLWMQTYGSPSRRTSLDAPSPWGS